MSSMPVHRGDVVMVDFPYSDRTGSTVRPALVVQADRLNHQIDDTIVAMITSSRRRVVGSPSQLEITSNHADFAASGLRMDSLIQCENLLTVDQNFILRTIGRLSKSTMQQIDDCLKVTLGIP
jgi:mRNA interferase MazF